MSGVRRFAILAGVLLALSQAGCVLLGAAAVGGSAVGLAVANGKVTRTYDATVEATARATESALRDLNLPVENPRVGKFYAEFDSTLATGGPIIIDLKFDGQPIPSDQARTRVGIHIKVFGDKAISERLLDQINHRLKNPAPIEATPATNALPPQPPLSEQTDEPGLAPKKQ